MTYKPLLTHLDSPKRNAPKPDPGVLFSNWLRDTFTIQTWLLFGAALQCILFALPLRPTLQYAPCLALLLIQGADTVLVLVNVKANPFTAGVIPGKHAAVLPNPDGSFERNDTAFPGGDKLAVFFLNVRSNHPLGVLAPGSRALGQFYVKMAKQLNEKAEEFEYLGSKTWIATDERTTRNERMTVFYFRNLAAVHRFAHGAVHREGWDWWSKTARQYPYLGFSHEAYEVPAGNWEAIYDQCQVSGLGLCSVPAKGAEGTKWVRTVVDANRGKMRTHQGRMGKTEGKENVEMYGEGVDPYGL